MQTKVQIEIQKTKKAVQVLRAIDHSIRSKVLNYVSEKPGSTVTDLYIKFRCEQSEMSQYLGTLRHAGFLTTEREGKNIKYYVSDSAFKIIDAVKKFAAKNP
jgi:predicted transcriptional regulator